MEIKYVLKCGCEINISGGENTVWSVLWCGKFKDKCCITYASYNGVEKHIREA